MGICAQFGALHQRTKFFSRKSVGGVARMKGSPQEFFLRCAVEPGPHTLILHVKDH